MTQLETFSGGYLLAPMVLVRPHGGKRAICPTDLYEQLAYEVGDPVYVSISGVRYELRPEWGVPADTIALPEDHFPHPQSEDAVVLVEKRSSDRTRWFR